MKYIAMIAISLVLTIALVMFAGASFEDPIHTIIVEHEYVPIPTDYEPMALEDINEDDAVLLAKTLWGEYRNADDYKGCAAVCWCILNRVDDIRWGDSVKAVVTQPQQFHGYSESNPVDVELLAIARDVLARWQMERFCIGDVGRVLPREFVYFGGNGTTNRYRDAYDVKKANYWEE